MVKYICNNCDDLSEPCRLTMADPSECYDIPPEYCPLSGENGDWVEDVTAERKEMGE